jgi:hypothetical protein
MVVRLQGKTEDSQETTSDDGCAVLGKSGSSGAGGGGCRAGSRLLGTTSTRSAAGSASGGGRGSADRAALVDGKSTAGGVLGLLALELLGKVLVGGVDASTVPVLAHESRDGLLVGGDGVVGVSAVAALAGELERLLAACQ